MPETTKTIDVAIIGAGPAGLMAAEVLTEAGYKPTIFEAMPTPARKFLMAGKSGLNLTHSEPLDQFLPRYGSAQDKLETDIRNFSPDDIRAWADTLGAHTFVGSSGRVFPEVFKASPLLRTWLKRLSEAGASLLTRHRWVGWGAQNDLRFETPNGVKSVAARATILALGGTSWPKLGSDGRWQSLLADKDIDITLFRPSNCGFLVNWSDHFKNRFAGEPIKNTILTTGNETTKGDFVISVDGIEGSAIYTLSAPLRDMIERDGKAPIFLDLTPDRSVEQLTNALRKPRGKKSFATFLKKATGLSGAKANLLRECLPAPTLNDAASLAQAIKMLPIILSSTRPVEEAISVAGGIDFNELDENLMLRKMPGIFAAGEMLDWEAPTGGYLLTACFAQGRRAGSGAITFLRSQGI